MAAAHIGALVAVETGDILAIDPDRPTGGLVKAADQPATRWFCQSRMGRPRQ